MQEDNKTAAFYEAQYQASLEKLNPAQRKAVDTVEGPVLVVAGPGAGKTTILTTRIGAILLKTDAKAQNVLCLTFTDAAAHNMRQRLLDTIGPEAHNVAINTFHAFCNRVIQENIEYFHTPRRLEPITDLERIEFLRDLLSQLPSSHALRKGRKGAFDFERQVRSLFTLMKKEGWNAERVGQAVAKYLSEIPNNEEFVYKNNTRYGRKGTLKQQKIEETTEKMERLVAAAELYGRWEAMLHRAGRYEYEDMILWVLDAFKKNPALLLTYQERFQYILVDEYQDTNGAQNELLFLLVNYWESPNVFIVGDDDQSIYEFQGARLRNLIEFYDKYESDLEFVLLNENYRSQGGILDAAGALIQHNQLRAANQLAGGVDKRPKTMREGKAKPQVFAYQNRLYELTALVQNIKKRLEAGIPPEEIAVLYYKHEQAEDLIKLLDFQEIPYETRRPIHIFSTPLIQQLLDLLAYLRQEQEHSFDGERFLFRLLHWPQFGFDTLELAKIAAALARERALEQEKTGKFPKVLKWRSVLADVDFLSKADVGNPASYLALSATLEALIRAVRELPVAQLLNRIYTDTNLISYYCSLSDKALYIQILHTFLSFVQEEARRKPEVRLPDILQTIQNMQENGIRLPLQQQIKTGTGIQLLTAHAAKGLEYDTVFMFECTKKVWSSAGRGNQGHFAMPETLTFSTEEDSEEAMRRLFFVVMTRAKNELVLSYAKNNSQGKPEEITPFLDEAQLEAQEMDAEMDAALETQIQLLLETPKPVISLPETAVLKQLLENYRLSITALNRFLRCRLAFYYSDFLKIPDTTSLHSAFGQAMHAAMQQLFQKMKLTKGNAFGDAKILGDFFQQALEERRGFISEKQFPHLLYLGRQHLEAYHAEQHQTWQKTSLVERHIRRTEVEGVPLTGTIDRVDFQENGLVHIIDYKTGDFAKRRTKKKLARPDEKQPEGGDYWRQMLFYKLLLEKSGMFAGARVAMGRISFLEKNKSNEFYDEYYAFHPAWDAPFKELLQSVWKAIQAFEFTEGCGESDCEWCVFHQTGVLGLERGLEEEELDDFF